MNRLNMLLLILVMGCALSVVSVTNQQRRVFVQVQRAQTQARQLALDYSQLQYQQSALSKTARIEQIATDSLKMQPVTTGRTQYLTLAPGVVRIDDEPILLTPDDAQGTAASGVGRGAGRDASRNPARTGRAGRADGSSGASGAVLGILASATGGSASGTASEAANGVSSSAASGTGNGASGAFNASASSSTGETASAAGNRTFNATTNGASGATAGAASANDASHADGSGGAQ